MTHGLLFSGIGGFDLAAEWMGWQNVFHCEWNTFGQRVLKHYWPNAISYYDITKTDFTIHRGRIDILTGGFPCQPYSMAGKRLGKEDDRHLWPEMLRAIREIQPRWVVGENVLGLVNWSDGLVFHEVQADLETEGYEVQPFVLPAVSVNAPHRRDRVWFVAYRNGTRFQAQRAEQQATRIEQYGKLGGDATDTDSSTTGTPREGESVEGNRSADYVQQSERREQAEQYHRSPAFSWDASDTNSNGQHGSNCEHEEQSGEGGKYAQRDIGESDDDGDATDTKCTGLEHWHEARNISGEEGKARRERGQPTNEFAANGDGKCNATDTSDTGLQGSEVIGSVGSSGSDRNQFTPGRVLPNWEKFPTVTPICDGDDGISNRLDGITFSKWRQESIKAGGNAVVPQVVLQIFRTIEEYEKMNTQ